MGARVVSAVHEAIKKGVLMKNSIAGFDCQTQKPYLEYPEGKGIYG